MKKSEWQPVYERLQPFIEDAARTHYEGDTERGFKFWAVSQVLMDSDLSDDQIKDPLLLDGKGDLGLDGYYEDTDTETLTLVQSRFHEHPAAVGNDELNNFFCCLNKVLNPQIVVAAKNPLAQDAHRSVRDAISRGWTLKFVFVTAGYLSPDGQVFARENSVATETIDSVTIRKELEVYDLERLKELYDSHLTPSRFNTDVFLVIPSASRSVSKIAGFNVLLAAVSGSELVRAFRQHEYALFRLNPRGPLQNKVNADILGTLRDPMRRKLFFHLNNGITAVCDSFKEADGTHVSIRDFQIVNGCQTTVTLAKAGPIVEADDDIKVLLRVIEGLPGLRDDVAKATNTQARLAAQDFKSTDRRQKSLKKEFDALPEPIFYEIKRGDWEMEQNKQRYLDTDSRTYRRVKMKDLAQATLAFLGDPGDAKDKSRTIFEDEARYRHVFPEDVRAQQLLLPWTVYRAADRECSAWTEFSGAEYARFCLVALVGLEMAPSRELPAVHDAVRLASRIDRIDSAISRGQSAVVAAIAALEEYPGNREFFRSADFFGKVLRTYRGMPKA